MPGAIYFFETGLPVKIIHAVLQVIGNFIVIIITYLKLNANQNEIYNIKINNG